MWSLIKKTFFLLIGLTLILWSLTMFWQKPAPMKYQTEKGEMRIHPSIRVDDKILRVEIADTDAKRARGLSGRESLSSGEGMLFLFENPGFHGFWMNEMNFAIDIIWLDDGWQVVGVERGVQPETFPKIFLPPSPVKRVLEVASGEALRLGIDTGVRLFFEVGN